MTWIYEICEEYNLFLTHFIFLVLKLFETSDTELTKFGIRINFVISSSNLPLNKTNIPMFTFLQIAFEDLHEEFHFTHVFPLWKAPVFDFMMVFPEAATQSSSGKKMFLKSRWKSSFLYSWRRGL